MDRSKIPRPSDAAQLVLLIVFLCLIYSLPVRAQDGPAASPSATPTPAAQKETRKGTFLGQVIDIDEETSTLTVKPADPRMHVKRFFYDKSTVYVSEGKKASFDDLYLGDKVAVRWFSEEWIHVAEKIFIVFGEFKPADYEDKPKEPKEPKKGEKKESAKGKSH